MDNINIIHYMGLAPCGHCCAPAVWKLDDGRWVDYECDAHARQWWVNEMYNYDQSVEAMEFIAAQMEWQQAERDFSEAFKALCETPHGAYTKLDYAVWSTADYADAAQAAYQAVRL